MPPIRNKIFNIPFSGGAATVVCLFKYNSLNDTSSVQEGSISVQYNADGTTVLFGSEYASLEVSVNSGVMTVKLTPTPEYKITDCRCCLIPGDPFA